MEKRLYRFIMLYTSKKSDLISIIKVHENRYELFKAELNVNIRNKLTQPIPKVQQH